MNVSNLNTSQKINIATIAYKLVSGVRRVLGKSDHAVLRRNGITWELDLQEGIDFSIFLLGGFELATLRLHDSILGPGDSVLDVGANIGAHTLPFARLLGKAGRVYARNSHLSNLDEMSMPIRLFQPVLNLCTPCWCLKIVIPFLQSSTPVGRYDNRKACINNIAAH
jgi:hypothetical protein